MLLSVIVPVYKVETYIRQCVESILGQTYREFELILVDDGSPDNCPAICDEYARKDHRVKVVHKENGGLVSARKAGARLAGGDYVCCIDGDDWIVPDYLEKAEAIIQNLSPDMICFGYFVDDGEHCKIRNMPFRTGFYDKQDIEKNLFPVLLENDRAVSFPPMVWAKVYKRELYTKYQEMVDESIVMGEDGAVVKPCIYGANSIYIDSGCVYYYRYNPSSITKSKKVLDWNGPILRAEHILRSIDVNVFDFQQQLYRSVVHSLFTVVVSRFYQKKRYHIITKEIQLKLNEKMYVESIENATFKNLRGKIVLFCFRRRWFLPIRIYSILK